MKFVYILFLTFSLNVLPIRIVSTEESTNKSDSEEITTTVQTRLEESEESSTTPNINDDKNVTETQNQITADQIGPIISQLLSPISSTIQPYLGPLAPLSSILGQVITNTVTEVVVSLLNDTVSSAKRQEFSQFKDYTTYLVNILVFLKNEIVEFSVFQNNYYHTL